MKEVRFQCKVLTPMFLAGPDPNAAPELRPPSLRGMLRYWYRTLLGARGIHDPEALLEASEAVFGSTEKASAVRVRVGADDSPETKAPKELLRGEGRSYLWHFVQAGDNCRSAIAANCSFELRFTVVPRRAGKAPKSVLQEAVRAFWLLVHLGGLGTRSRRCAGAFSAHYEHRPPDLNLPLFGPEAPHAEWLRAQLNTLDLPKESATRPEFDHLGQARIWVGARDFARYSAAVDKIGAAYKDFRDRLTVGQKVALGLPVRQGEDQVRVTRPDGGVERRASPLWMQLVETPAGRYRPIYTLFEDTFLPESGTVMVDGQPFKRVVKQMAPQFIEEQGARELFRA